MTAPPPDPPPGGDSERYDALEESARVRRSIAETIARVRALTAGIGDAPDAREADDPPSPSPDESAADSSEAREVGEGDDLSGEVSALVDRTRRVIENTRRLLAKSRRDSAERRGE